MYILKRTGALHQILQRDLTEIVEEMYRLLKETIYTHTKNTNKRTYRAL